jgi:hypothetical protein
MHATLYQSHFAADAREKICEAVATVLLAATVQRMRIIVTLAAIYNEREIGTRDV